MNEERCTLIFTICSHWLRIQQKGLKLCINDIFLLFLYVHVYQDPDLKEAGTLSFVLQHLCVDLRSCLGHWDSKCDCSWRLFIIGSQAFLVIFT
jgi:hypothetical protein